METSQKMIDMILFEFPKKGIVFEPHAGIGKLADALKEDGMTVKCGELNKAYVKVLQDKGYDIMCYDFMRMPTSTKFPYIAAVPPYKNNIDCHHIMKMYDHLEDGGKLVSFTHPAWTTGFYDNQIEFRRFLRDKTVRVKFLEDDNSYMSCPKMLLIIQK